MFFVAGAVSGFAAVALGAFAAHALRARVTPDMLTVFETGARYHMYHALALLAVAWVGTRGGGASATAAGWLFIAGTVIFSGSLYLMGLTGHRWLGAITPIGGACLLAGWVALAIAGWRAA